ncbi:MAG: arsenic efflux protein [Clostridia bacterium]|nr:arsenic efflux protein [Clostridia bacterium]
MKHIIIHTLKDSLPLLPFLFIAFLIIESIEHKFSKKSKEIISKSGKFGPLFGSILGCFPQCGFSVMATNLYVTRIISLGTLIAVYLSTSDEMLPILLSEQVAFSKIIKLLLVKFIIGLIWGFIIDLVLFKNKKKVNESFDICDDEHCHCDKGIFKSSLIHTVKTFLFILLVTFIINLIIYYIGEDKLSMLLQGNNILTPFISSLIGLIPNCASSVILTELFINNIISTGSLISGLLTGSGVAILVLFKTNNNLKDSFKILILCYSIGVLSGLILNILGFTI